MATVSEQGGLSLQLHLRTTLPGSDVVEGFLIRELKGHTHGAVYCSWISSGAEVFTASHDGTVRIYEVVTSTVVL